MAIAIRYGAKGVLGKPSPREEPFEAIVGEPFSHLDRGVYNFTAAVRHAVTGEKYISGKNKGELKWKVEARRAGEEFGMAVSMYYGAPTYAPYKIGKGVHKTVVGEEKKPTGKKIDVFER